MIDNAQKEELRRAVLEVLATREGNALNLAGIRRRIEQGQMVDFKFIDEVLNAALVFLEGLKLVSLQHDGLGATKYWQATSNGVLAHERGVIV